MKRGAIYWVNLEPASPPEFGKTRPGLILSNSEQNLILDTVVILPISSQKPEIWPLRLEFKMPSGKWSYAVLPGIRQIHKARLLSAAGLAPSSLLARLPEALAAYLGE